MTKTLIWQLYRARDGWRWRVKSRNGRIICAASEGYRDRKRAVTNAVLFGAPINISEKPYRRMYYLSADGHLLA